MRQQQLAGFLMKRVYNFHRHLIAVLLVNFCKNLCCRKVSQLAAAGSELACHMHRAEERATQAAD